MIKAGLGLAALVLAAMNAGPDDAGKFSAELVTYDASPVSGFADPTLRTASCRRDFEFYGAIDKKKTALGHGGLYRWRSLGDVGDEQGFYLGQRDSEKPVKLVIPVTVPLGRSIVVTAQLEVTEPEHIVSDEVKVTFQCLPRKTALPAAVPAQ